MTTDIAKTALITGASAGIGREFALQLHEQGYNLVIVARRSKLLNELKVGLEQLRANSVLVYACDITSPSEGVYQELLNYIKNSKVDLLVNNAGRGSFGYFDQLDLNNELDLVELNITATLRLAHAVIPQMKARKSGTIISISSIAAYQPLPYMATYAGTKAFNLQHSLALWAELKSYGIRVLTVCPGPVATEFGGVARVPGTITGGNRDTAQAVVKKALKDLDRGLIVSLPGIKAKLMWLSVILLPVRLTTMLLGSKLKQVLRAVRK